MAINALSGGQAMMPAQPGMASPMGTQQTQNLQMGQMPMNGVTPIYQMPGQATPGGGGTGFPMQGGLPGMGDLQSILANIPGLGNLQGMGNFGSPGGFGPSYMNALHGWMQQRPSGPTFDGNRQDFRSALNAWRQQQPHGGGGYGGPAMTPGGGGTGAPLQGPPMQQPPQPAPQMSTNPYAFPTY